MFFIALGGGIFYLRQKNLKAFSQKKVTAKIDTHIVTAFPNEQIYEAQSVQPVLKQSLELVGIGGAYSGNRIPISHEIILGRDPSRVHLVFEAHEVSRQHLRIRIEHPFVLLEDLASSNGTFICLPNGTWQPLSQMRIPFNQIHGAQLQLGRGNLKFRIEQP